MNNHNKQLSSSSSMMMMIPNNKDVHLLHRLNSNMTNLITNNHDIFIDDLHICKVILYKEINDTSIHIWDLIIFIPNILFLLYLIWHSQSAKDRVRQLKNFPILRNFYIFIYLCVIISMIRCIISSLMKVHTFGGDLTDKIFWVIVRFFLLSTEISVLVFGLFAGHLDVRQSIRRILTITLIISLVYSICQGSFEIISPDASFYIHSKSYYLFGHGGMIFWFGTCFLSFFIYLIVVLLPWSPCRHRLLLPTKRSFYFYAATLSSLNLIQAIGALLFFLNVAEGLCIVDATTYLYFTFFTPLVYFIFLSPFLAAGTTNSVASALVTTTVGVESTHNPNRPIVPLTRPTNLFNSGVRGAVNFSYRPQIDDEIENEDEFASSIGSFTGGGLHFDHYGPYAYNQQQQQGRHGYLNYSGSIGSGGIPRDFSSFSMQTAISTNSNDLLENQNIDLNRSGKKSNTNLRIGDKQSNNGNDDSEMTNAKDHLLESHMLKEQKSRSTTTNDNQCDEKMQSENILESIEH
uniref:Transmembrane protein adipocyte-associated 1 homolog n=1 Tax=Dermatophagoides pteronyssinus TaxID=6956 RepID=A0A6P6XZY8_DERPT|nr:transmembrane protein adipocyte-associated 1 homolog [Dermatophagoides pteronyssinus]